MDSDAITFCFHSIKENQTEKSLPPPVPCRTQKPLTLPIAFEELTKQSHHPQFPLNRRIISTK
jgi:hypothetical protein